MCLILKWSLYKKHKNLTQKKKHKILNKVSLTLSIMQMVTSVAIYKIFYNLIGILKWYLRPNIESSLPVRRRTSISILYVNS